MALLVANNALKAFSACSTALAFKMFVTLSIQGGKSFDAGARPPEDNKFNREGVPTQNYGLAASSEDAQPSPALLKAREVDFRWKRIVQNDLETIPIGLAVLLGSVLAGGHETTNVVFISAFAAARISHTFAYANELQPHRAICWTVGQLCVLASGLNGVISFIIGSKKSPTLTTQNADGHDGHDDADDDDVELQENEGSASLQGDTRRRGKSKRKD